MKTYQCDRCFKTKSLNEIVGTEFEYHGFKTLVPTFAPIRDVCGDCYKEIMGALMSSKKEHDNRPYDDAKKVAHANRKPKRSILSWW